MKNKGLIFFITFLFLLSTSASIVGYLESKKENNEKPPVENKDTITYEYYLEDVLQTSIPTNNDNEEQTYIFNRYQCDNDVTGRFDNDDWKFIPSEEKNATCKIYFVKSFYDITITAANGTVSENNPTTIERENDGKFTVIPNEGYEFKEVNCSNDKKATFDTNKNILSINVIMEDIACKVNFEIKSLRADIIVKNGDGTTTETVNYGESITAIVQPKDGYENPKITCTNNQEATFDNNKITIEKLTDNTKCNVEFVKVKPVTFDLSFDELDEDTKEKIQIITGSTDTVKVSTDGSYSLTIKANEGFENYKAKVVCGKNTIVPTPSEDGSYIYTISGLTENTKCTITAQENVN